MHDRYLLEELFDGADAFSRTESRMRGKPMGFQFVDAHPLAFDLHPRVFARRFRHEDDGLLWHFSLHERSCLDASALFIGTDENAKTAPRLRFVIA